MYEPGIHVRPPSEGDAEDLARLILRYYRFNEEFDPAWSLAEDAGEQARRLAAEYIAGKGVTLVALCDSRVIGYVHAEVRENPMLESKRIGVITELYVHPECRGRGIATRLVEETSRALAAQGVERVAAEYPTANYVARRFYESRGFRPYTSLYLREV